MKKGIKKGALVTAWKWYMDRRVYGRITSYLGNSWWGVQGQFGLEQFHISVIRPVKLRGAP